jgi:hypothetical protein
MVTPTPTSTETVTQTPTEELTATATDVATQTPTPQPTIPPVPNVDHTDVGRFEELTQEQLILARATKMVYLDRSVGDNINDGLLCLEYVYSVSPHRCRVGSPETWTGFYPRPNWYYGAESGTWDVMVRDFIQVKFPYWKAQGATVISFQFSYLNVENGSTIMNFFNPNYNGLNVFDLMELEAQNPDITVIYWTTSLARTIGTSVATQFNNAMREFAAEHSKPLFDVADIESHDLNDNLCELNGNPIICSDYSTELYGGHLGSMATGKIRIAKLFWVLMVDITQ